MTVDPSELHRPVDEWPLILAGPMLRRVTATSVAVFVATKAPLSAVMLTVYDSVEGDRRPLTPQTAGSRGTLALGAKLHVCVVEATGLALQPGQLYGYDLRLEPVVGAPTDLWEEGLLSGLVPLGYLEALLPGFVLPGPLDTLRIVQGSCRKVHGCVSQMLTDPDVLPLVDRLIQDRRSDPWNRPQQLFLTGDQLYSDDVPAALLAAAMSAGRELLDWRTDEQLPDLAGGVIADPPNSDPAARSIFDPGGSRSWLLDAQGVKDRPVTADPTQWDLDWASNHLLFLSEWCAMYLFAWSPELWQRAENVPGAEAGAFTYYLAPASNWAIPPADPAAAPNTTLPALIYAENLPFVRRALANVATYMVFDDHDFTDDWFLNAKLAAQERGTPLGRRLLRNALSAYAVFQHWGNAPEAFVTATPGGRLLELLDAASGTPPISTAAQSDAAEVVLDIGVRAVGVARRDERLRWDYELLFEEHRVIVLDTRTWRGYPDGARAVSESEILQAGAQTQVVTAGWGPDVLDAVAERWVGAAEDVPPAVAAFLRAGGGALFGCAALARIAAEQLDEFEGAALEALASTMALLDAVRDAPGTANQAAAPGWFAAARDAVGSPDYHPGSVRTQAVMRVSRASQEASFLLRAGRTDVLSADGADALDDQAHAYLVAVEGLAAMLEHGAAFLRGALHARPNAARHAEALARAWSVLAVDAAPALWSVGDADAAGDALWAAGVAVAPLYAELAAAAAAHTAAPDSLSALIAGADRRSGAELISAAALDFQVHERVQDSSCTRALTLVVSSTPVFGHDAVEMVQRVATICGGTDVAEETNEAEPWAGNQPARIRLLDALAPLESVVFLSGDVHYAFSSATDYLTGAGQPARFLQLTSSSLKNANLAGKGVGVLDDARSFVPDVTIPLDFIATLPTEAQWTGFGVVAQQLIASRERVLTALAVPPDTAADTADPLIGWLRCGYDMVTLLAELDKTGDTGWEEVTRLSETRTTRELDAVGREWDDPVSTRANGRAHASTGVEERTLALGEVAGVDARLLPEIRTTTLRDPRGLERANDSPGLIGRLTDPTLWARVGMAQRTTVGNTNIGVITTRTTPMGRFLTHELHWFLIDGAVDAGPGAASSFRDDWLITRHCGGLVVGTAPDGASVGACGTSVPVTHEVRLRIDVTSPAQTQPGPSRVHAIQAAAPTMPEITVQVRSVGLSAAADAGLVRRVRLTCTYDGGGRHDVVQVPDPGDQLWQTLEAGRITWRPSFPCFCGGQLQVFAEADFGGTTIQGVTGPLEHLVLGRNPAKADIRQHGRNVAEPAGAELGTNMEVVFHRESSFTQFAASAAVLGPFVAEPATVLRSPGRSFGAGQLDDPPPTIEECWHWRKNVEGAVARLEDFRSDAIAYQDQVRNGSSWTAATGTLEPAPPAEGIAFPDATAFTPDELDLEMWARYNSGRRFHDWQTASGGGGGGGWVQQPSSSTGVTVYAPALLAMRRRVDAGDLPADW